MKNVVIGVVGVLLGAIILFVYIGFEITNLPEGDFHEHADFAMFIDGEQVNFALPEFMTDTSCSVSQDATFKFIPTALAHSDDDEGEDDTYDKYVHMHDGVGTVVHVHKKGITWSNFFESLGMTLADDEFIDSKGIVYAESDEKQFYYNVNNEFVDSIADREIRNFDQVLISLDSKEVNEERLFAQYGHVTNRVCEQSGGCEHRGMDVIESCTTKQPLPWILDLIGYPEN